MAINSKGWKPIDQVHHSRSGGYSPDFIIKFLFNMLGPVLFGLALAFSPVESLDPRTHQIIALAIWMLIWWITEFVPLPVTSLLPLVILPAFGVLGLKLAAAPYSSPVIFLFLGGFIIALALEKWNLHKRIALKILKVMGEKADYIVLGFILVSAFLSMWISNTATVVMMLPIVLSVNEMISKNSTESPKKLRNLKLSMLLGLAYGANVGGMGTLIGTPPNAILAGIINSHYNIEVGFLEWMLFALPIVIILIFIMFIILTKVVYPNKLGHIDGFTVIVEKEIDDLGDMSKEEKSTLFLFCTAAFLWITRGGINHLLGTSIGDTSIAVLVGILFFIVPTGRKTGERLLEWKDTQKLPWGVLILFGGGLSIASALSGTGILTMFADLVTNNKDSISMPVLTFGVMLFLVILTEMISNTALATIFTPILAAIGVGLGLSPLVFAAPMILAMSCVFSLPMGTPPNAIVFASGEIKIKDMAKVGVFLDPAAVIVISLIGAFLARMFLS